MSVISHITLGTNDKSRSKAFYDAALGAIGFKRVPKPAEKPLAYDRNGQMPTIYIYTPEDGRPATPANRSMPFTPPHWKMVAWMKANRDCGATTARITTRPTFVIPMAIS